MKIIKRINNENHIIEFSNIKKLETFFKNNFSKIDILIIDRNLIKNNHIKKINNIFYDRIFILGGSEKIKSLTNYSNLIEKILKKGIQRKSKLISIGGGTIGDLSGFIASTLLRGIDHIMIPTSLLAMVDSSIGGKTGINSIHGKNLIGSFYLPKKVMIFPEFLQSLPKRELNCGFAEIIKYSFISPGQMRSNLLKFKDLKKSNIKEIIKLSILIKLKYIADFKEKSTLRKSRAILNFGHTIGHAIENTNSYAGNIKHGEAIALGMIIELKISKLLNVYKRNLDDEILLFKKFNLPINYKNYLIQKNIKTLLRKMKFDKKASGQFLNFILIDKNGGLVKKLTFKKIEELLNKID